MRRGGFKKCGDERPRRFVMHAVMAQETGGLIAIGGLGAPRAQVPDCQRECFSDANEAARRAPVNDVDVGVYLA